MIPVDYADNCGTTDLAPMYGMYGVRCNESKDFERVGLGHLLTCRWPSFGDLQLETLELSLLQRGHRLVFLTPKMDEVVSAKFGKLSIEGLLQSPWRT